MLKDSSKRSSMRSFYLFQRSLKKVANHDSLKQKSDDKLTQSNKNFGGPARVILSAFVVFSLSQVLALVLIETGFHIFHGGTKISLDQSAAAQFIYILLAEAAVIGSVVWLVRRRGLKLAAIGLGRRIKWWDIIWAAIGSVAFYGLLIIVTVILTALTGFNANAPQDVGFNVLSTPTDRLIALIALVILPPLGEEILMRGYLYSGLRARLRFWPAMVITSLLFGIAHLSTGANGALWVAGVDTFLLSFVLVALRERTGALYAPIMVHGLNNLVAFFSHFHG
ncbi:hypothetical protein BVY00_01180 [bacterium G20]|nr:hypothetical protein BVY00_01180 [bacterium G20]